jgi:tRNA(Arg) A34 adenosine deaminase TadA
MSGWPHLCVDLPPWVDELVPPDTVCPDEDAAMRRAIALAERNVVDGGGPFGAVVVERASGRVVGAGVNRVLALGNCSLHAEIVALAMAERRLGRLALPDCSLVTSCEPCAMCLGATLWSGVGRLICGARREDAEAIGFDEGPVFAESYRYLEGRGVEVARDVQRDAARAVLEAYRRRGLPLY